MKFGIMKFGISFGAAVALFSTGGDAECSFCPNGLVEGAAATVMPGSDGGQTCGSLLEIAPTLAVGGGCEEGDEEGDGCAGCTFTGDDAPASGSESCEWNGDECFLKDGTSHCLSNDGLCTRFQDAHVMCCPDELILADEPCPICPGGAGEGLGVTDLGDGFTCDRLVAYATTIEKDDDACAELAVAGSLCCPDDVTPVDEPCPVCPGGAGEGLGATAIPGVDGFTCDSLVTYATTIEKDDDACAVMAGADLLCCPIDVSVEVDPEGPAVEVKPEGPTVEVDPEDNATDTESGEASETDNGATAVGWREASVSTAVVAMVMLLA